MSENIKFRLDAKAIIKTFVPRLNNHTDIFPV